MSHSFAACFLLYEYIVILDAYFLLYRCESIRRVRRWDTFSPVGACPCATHATHTRGRSQGHTVRRDTMYPPLKVQ